MWTEDTKIPETAEEHLAVARQYEQKAAMWRDEAAYHRQMAATYKTFSKSLVNPGRQDGAALHVHREGSRQARSGRSALAAQYRQRANALLEAKGK